MEVHELRAMLDADERHWWYEGRRRVVAAVLERMGLQQGRRALDAGCGSGRMLDELSGYDEAIGVEGSPVAVEVAHERGHDSVRQGRLEALDFPDASFDLVTCFDVVEHIEDDRAALAELRRVTAPGGHLMLTVPAYPALWSDHDVRNLHKRRYRMADLRRLAPEVGWEPMFVTHFNAVLLPPAAIVRFATRRRPPSAGSDLTLSPPRLDPVLRSILGAEASLLRHGGRLPFGLSILAVMSTGVPVEDRAARSLPVAQSVPRPA